MRYYIVYLGGDRSLRKGFWLRDEHKGEELSEKCVALLGYGHTARASAARLRSFGCRICAYDKYLEECPDPYVELVSLEELHRSADVLSIHLPSTTETRHFVDQRFIEAFVRPIFFGEHCSR